MNLQIIVAASLNRVIGKNNQLPWSLRKDMKYFRDVTDGCVVVMGRKTWESLPDGYRPLPNRQNIVLSNNPDYQAPGAVVVTSLDDINDHIMAVPKGVFVIGGEEIYKLALPRAVSIYLTQVKATIEGDAFFPVLNAMEWHEISRESHQADSRNDYDFDFVIYERL